MERPSRADFYAMRIAQRVQQVMAFDRANEVTLDNQRVTFVSPIQGQPFEGAAEPGTPRRVTKEDIDRMASRRHKVMFGVPR